MAKGYSCAKNIKSRSSGKPIVDVVKGTLNTSDKRQKIIRKKNIKNVKKNASCDYVVTQL